MRFVKTSMDIRNYYKLLYSFLIFFLFLLFHTLVFSLVSSQAATSTVMSAYLATPLERKQDPLGMSLYSYLPEEPLRLSYGENAQFLQALGERFQDVTTKWCRNLSYGERLICLEVLDRSIPDTLDWIDRIPDAQSIIGNLPRYIEQEAIQKIQTDCLNACYDDSVAKLFVYGSETQYNYVINTLKGGGQPCLRPMLRASRRQLNQYRDFMFNFQSKTARNHHYHSGLVEAENLILERILSLEDMTSKRYTSKYISLQSGRSSADNTEDFEQQDICSEYKIGEERVLSVPFLSMNVFSKSFFQLQSHYKVHRTLRNTYTVSVALEFFPGLSYYDEPVPKDQVHKYYIDKIRSCMKKAGPKLRGPHGQNLVIHIEDAQQANTCNPTYSIRIHDVKIPTSYMNYDISFTSCDAILHEIAHFFGFGDAYEPKLIKLLSQGLKSYVPEVFHAFGFGDAYELKLIELLSQGLKSYVPEIFHIFGFGDAYESKLTELLSKRLKSYVPEVSVFDCRVMQKNSIMSEWAERWKSTFTENTETSLIDPVHFNAILYGNCPDRDDVRLFRQCDALSFQNSSFNPDCLEKKVYCERQNLLGRDKNKELQTLDSELRDKQRDFDRFFRGGTDESSVIDSQSEDKSTLEQEIRDLNRRIDLVRQWPD